MSLQYIDWTEEVHSIDPFAAVDIVSTSPMTEETPDGILLKLFPHQRVVASALLRAEAKGYVTTTIKPIKDMISKKEDDQAIARFYTNMYALTIKVGSGKTAIVFTMIACKRVPDHREVIIGIDSFHSGLMYHRSETAKLPKVDMRRYDLACEWPCYYKELKPTFPSITPKSIHMHTVKEEYLMPTNLFFVAKHLCDQIECYCKEQVTFPWKVIKTLDDLYETFSQACIDPTALSKYHLIVIYTEKLIQSEYQACIDKLRKLEGVTSHRPSSLRGLLMTTMEPSTYEFVYLWCYSGRKDQPTHFARIFYDDYDSLPTVDCYRVPALTHVFISGTAIQTGVLNYGFISKLLYARHARISCQITVLPKKLEQILRLPDSNHTEIQCTDDVMKLFVLQAIHGIRNMAITLSHELYSKEHWEAHFSVKRQTMKAHDDAINKAIIKLEKTINGDGDRELMQDVDAVNELLLEYGMELTHSGANETRTALSTYISIVAHYMTYYRTLDIIQTSVAALLKIMTKPPEKVMGYILPLYEKLVMCSTFPPRDLQEREMIPSMGEPTAGIKHIFNLLPLNSLDWLEVYGKISPWCVASIAPYLFKFIRSINGLRQVRNMLTEESLRVTESAITNVMSSIRECAPPSMSCTRCGDPSGSTCNMMLCCGSFMCQRCYLSETIRSSVGVQCGICGHPVSDENTPISSRISMEMIKNYQWIETIIDGIKDKPTESAYVPQTSKYLGNAIKSSGVKRVTPSSGVFGGSKPSKIKEIVTDWMSARHAIPRILVYCETASAGEKINEALGTISLSDGSMVPTSNSDGHTETTTVPTAGGAGGAGEKTAHYKCNVFNEYSIEEMKSDKLYGVVASSLQSITGLNMQFLDIIIFYSPCDSEEKQSQIIGRALRTGRREDHLLSIYTLYYPNEKIGKEKSSTKGDASMNAYYDGYST